MANERIEELMRTLTENGDLELAEEEYNDEGEPCVDITDAPALAKADFTLIDDRIVDEESILAALGTEQLEAELDRRCATDGDTIVV
jgi:hypothetical protein